jgi:hypothetical protein
MLFNLVSNNCRYMEELAAMTGDPGLLPHVGIHFSFLYF